MKWSEDKEIARITYRIRVDKSQGEQIIYADTKDYPLKKQLKEVQGTSDCTYKNTGTPILLTVSWLYANDAKYWKQIEKAINDHLKW